MTQSRCRIGELMETTDPDIQKMIRETVNSAKFSATRLAFILTHHGLACGETTIRKHRRGECLCRLQTT